MGYTIGIDLGTTNSVMAYIKDGKPEIIPNNRGERLTPSCVAVTKDKEVLVGQSAKNQALISPERTIVSVKRLMGTKEKISIDANNYTPEEISGIILKKLKEDAETFLGDVVTDAVITVPAYFNDNQRAATMQAAKIAGLNVLRIINEPTAAALAYGANNQTDGERIIIMDLGGGTYDVSLLDVGDNVYEVLASSGNNKLGGDDFDKRIVEYILSAFLNETGIDLSGDVMALQRMYEQAVKAKIELSEAKHTAISIPFITADELGPRHLEMRLTRAQFEDLIRDYIEQLDEPFYRVLDDAGVKVSDLTKMILVGGSTRIPAVERRLHELSDMQPFKNINPDECVALGAAIQAGIIQGTLSCNNDETMILVDVTPFSLGIEIDKGAFAPLIARNSPIPVSRKQNFTTVSDYQKVVEVKVFQGEAAYVKENHFLGSFELSDITPMKKGEPDIEVTFSIDQNGVLSVTACDMQSGVTQEIEIKNMSSLSDDEVTAIIEESNKQEAMLREKEDILLTSAQEMITALQAHESGSDEGEKEDIAHLIDDMQRHIQERDCMILRELIETARIIVEGHNE